MFCAKATVWLQITIDECCYTSGIAILNKIRDLNFQLTWHTEAFELIEEADKVFNMRRKKRGGIGHWSQRIQNGLRSGRFGVTTLTLSQLSLA